MTGTGTVALSEFVSAVNMAASLSLISLFFCWEKTFCVCQVSKSFIILCLVLLSATEKAS